MIKKIILLTLISISSLFALSEENIKEEMTESINKALVILKNKSIEKNKRAEDIISVMNGYFDYKVMSKISLGKKWRSLDKKQKEEFINIFTNKLKNSYIDKLELYTDQKVLVKDTKKIKKNRIYLYSDIIGKDATYEVIYKFYKNKKENTWKIYDVDIIGVSIIQTYRSQFSGFLQKNSFEDLLVSLKK